MRAPITDKHLLEMMWKRFPEIMQRGAEQPAQQEPVAYIKTWHENGEQHVDIWQWEVGIEALKDGNHYLYTSPPAQRKPLTDEQIIQVANETYGPTSEWEVEQIRLDFARAIEAAHGIKENT